MLYFCRRGDPPLRSRFLNKKRKEATVMTDAAEKYFDKLYPNGEFKLASTDPEFADFFANFSGDEVVNQDDLDDRTRMMAVLGALLGCQGIDEFREILPGALNLGLTPVEVKEIVYQACAYLGFGRVRPFFDVVNDVLTEEGVSLPLEGQATTSIEDRVEKGEQAQVDIFGDGMKGFSSSGPEESRHINRWLSGNCFGDYYTRTGLDHRQREMITFCFLAAQGGCEPQLTSHAAGNMKVGNDKAFLIKIISQCLPYIGYPRSLNALRCVNEAAGQQ
jgi:4-carboxymuconolactone decarboxylase